MPGVGLIERPLWLRNRQLGNLWLRGHATIPPSESFSSYSVVFEGIVGKGIFVINNVFYLNFKK